MTCRQVITSCWHGTATMTEAGRIRNFCVRMKAAVEQCVSAAAPLRLRWRLSMFLSNPTGTSQLRRFPASNLGRGFP